jgi:hypothetical protein
MNTQENLAKRVRLTVVGSRGFQSLGHGKPCCFATIYAVAISNGYHESTLKRAVHKRVLLLGSSTQEVERRDFWFSHDKAFTHCSKLS